MTYLQQQFLSQFDQPIRQYIIEYCKKLSEKNYDVYVLMARKAACFMSVLESLGFVSLNGIVVSDRVQVFNSGWLKGKRIVIIDDTIISGTTIYKLIDKLESMGVAEITVHTFCVDSYWYSEDMLRCGERNYLVQPYMKLEHSSCIRFCRQIVNALSVVPRPYNIDFPTYEIRRLSKHNYHNILSDINWKVVCTTTILQSRNDVDSISLNFKRNMLDYFFESLGFDFRNTMFVKVRLFTKKLFDNKDPRSFRYSVRIVPYVIFNKIEVHLVDKVISAICVSEGMEEALLKSELSTDCAKMIFLQYYFSVRLMKWWVEYTERYLEKKLDVGINKRSLSLLFSPSVIDLISNFSYLRPIQIDTLTFSQIDNNTFVDYTENIQAVNPLEVKDSLTRVFLDLYYEKELPARRLALKYGKEVFTDNSHARFAHRLECGVSMLDLKKRIASYVNNSTDANLILSTFLDNAIDSGIAVPITIFDKGVLYRGFRHGEEVVWGDANDKMLALFFERIFGKNAVVPKLQFEKMLSLFVKLGLKKGLLTDYNFSLPENKKVKIVGVRSYLYGQVTICYEILPGQKIQFNPVLDSEDTGQWTTTRFKDLGLIKEQPNGGYELHFENLHYVQYEKKKGTDEAEDLDPYYLNDINDMAEVFKMCYDYNLLNDDKLVLLTSCVSVIDNTSALNAEIVLFKNGVDSYLNRIRGAVCCGGLSIDFLKGLRDKRTQKIWTAVNSGKSKFIHFREGNGKKIINEIEARLEEKNGFASRSWWQFWNQEKELTEALDADIEDLNSKSGRILIDILGVMTCLHVFLYERIRRDGKINDIKKKIKELEDALGNNKGNNILEENNKKEIRKDISSLKRRLNQWSNYALDSCNLINTSVSILSTEEKIQMKFTELFQTIVNGKYKNLSDDDLYKKTMLSIDILESLKLDSEAVYDEYKMIVPLWGKMDNFSQYVSLIHVKQQAIGDNKYNLNDIANMIILSVENEEYKSTRNEKSLSILNTKESVYYSESGVVIGGKGERHVERMIKIAGQLLLYFNKNKINDISISFFPVFKENGIRAYYNDNSKKNDLLKQEIYSLLPANDECNCIKVYTEKQQTEYYYYSVLRQTFHGKLKVECVKNEGKDLKFKIMVQPLSKKIFISYSRKDVDYKDELIKHLNTLKLYNIVDSWCCEQIREDTWNEEIQKELDESDIIIYMLSVNFFSSSYIIEHEVCNVMENKGGRKVLCVLVSDFTDLDRIKDNIKERIGLHDKKNDSILELCNFQYLPYGRVFNKIRQQNEEKLIPLVNYTNITGNHIDSAYKSIVERVLKLLKEVE